MTEQRQTNHLVSIEKFIQNMKEVEMEKDIIENVKYFCHLGRAYSIETALYKIVSYGQAGL